MVIYLDQMSSINQYINIVVFWFISLTVKTLITQEVVLRLLSEGKTYKTDILFYL